MRQNIVVVWIQCLLVNAGTLAETSLKWVGRCKGQGATVLVCWIFLIFTANQSVKHSHTRVFLCKIEAEERKWASWGVSCRGSEFPVLSMGSGGGHCKLPQWGPCEITSWPPSWKCEVVSKILPGQSMRIYVKNMPHFIPIWFKTTEP